ncbi:hypothetical protein GIB67_011246 [Kingdonia uniflora]|uniref:non-specific serine/threonine protein kinase n=1 Tax=Kingdonia uniflora TaxID=39325 RepID=A0A7J7NVF8_9MAGN|nr:hypothetical protein GIB67_011246 [Kingdonia uniflora]
MDTGLQSGICSSLPRHSLTDGNFSRKDPYKLPWFIDPVVFLNCPFQVESPNYLDTSPCNSSDMHSYVVPGNMPVSDLKDSCIISLTVVTSGMIPFYYKDWNTSFSDIRQGLLMGIELEWYNIYCGKCLARGADECTLDSDNKVICQGYYCLGRLTIHCIYENYCYAILAWIKKICKMIGFILAGRTLCGILCLLIFLVYKFRRRHLSMDYGIEEFLQGKLRSGRLVAVKMLEKYIFPENDKNMYLSWEKMYEIALGVAHGIEYLHRGCTMQILHFDIKPHDILLDKNFNPIISDFGLAKLEKKEFKRACREFKRNLLPDVCLQSTQPRGGDGNMRCHRRRKEIAKKLAVVALWCIQLKPTDRPSMNKVVEMLKSAIETLQMPPKLSLVPEDRIVASSAEASPLSQSETHSRSNSVELISLDLSP